MLGHHLQSDDCGVYLHQNSHHHPANKQSVLASLIHRAKALCEQDSLLPKTRISHRHLQGLDTAINRYDEP
jgi:hypothetical protein